MNKSMVIVACAVVAATMATLVPAAEAGRGGMRLGGGMRMGGGHHHHHHQNRRHFRPVHVAPSYTEEARSVRRTGGATQVALVKYADGKGRMYDLASKVWFDGKSNCWSGKYPWTFKNGTWSYGSYRWFQADGMWQTDAPEAPAAVDCETVPVFAAKLKPARKMIVRKETVESMDETEQSPKTTIKTAVKGAADKPAKPTECKKYFPSVGEMLSVPCQ